MNSPFLAVNPQSALVRLFHPVTGIRTISVEPSQAAEHTDRADRRQLPALVFFPGMAKRSERACWLCPSQELQARALAMLGSSGSRSANTLQEPRPHRQPEFP